MCIYSAAVHTEQSNACMCTQSLSVHRNTHTCISYPVTHVCMPLTHMHVHNYTLCAGSCPIHSVTDPQAAAPNPTPSNLHSEAHGTHVHTCMQGHLSRNARRGDLHVSCIAHGRKYALKCFQAWTQTPSTRPIRHSQGCCRPGKPFPPCPSQLTRLPFSPIGPRGPGRPVDP